MIESWQTLDLLSTLVDKSLVVYETDADGVGRYRMLESVRQYAQDRLHESGEGKQIRQAHRAFQLQLWEGLGEQINGPEQARVLAELEAEHDNLRIAMEADAPSDEHDADRMRLAIAAEGFFNARGFYSEGRGWLMELLSQPTPTVPLLRARALNIAGALAWRQGDYAAARAILEEARPLWTELGDAKGLRHALTSLANVLWYQGEHEQAEPVYEEVLSLTRKFGEKAQVAGALNNIALVAQAKGEYERARAYYEEALTIRRERGDTRGIANILGNLSQTLIGMGDTEAARPLIAESMEIRRTLGDRLGVAYTLQYTGRIALGDGDADAAQKAFAESLVLRQELGEKWGFIICFSCFADLAVFRQEEIRAVRLWAAEETLRQAIGAAFPPTEREARDKRLAEMRTVLGDDVFEEAWVAGREWTTEQAIAFALNDKPNTP